MQGPRRVSFDARNYYSRLPHDDELYVMQAFARHAEKCESCYDPYQVYKSGSTLCPRGHQRAIDVAQYVYTRAGVSFSQTDRERNQRVQIEIPANCQSVRSLLKAMDRGLRIMRRVPPTTSYDKTYYIPARLSVPDNTRSTPQTRPVTPYQRSQSHPTVLPSPKLETSIPPPQTRPRARSRGLSASSVSSTGSTTYPARTSSLSSRSSRPCFVRSRSRDANGKRTHSPIYIRPGSRVEQPSRPRHERKESSSSTSSRESRSGSVFSRGSSRNSSVSSQSSIAEEPNAKLVKGMGKMSLGPEGAGKMLSEEISFREPIYYDIKPREERGRRKRSR